MSKRGTLPKGAVQEAQRLTSKAVVEPLKRDANATISPHVADAILEGMRWAMSQRAGEPPNVYLARTALELDDDTGTPLTRDQRLSLLETIWAHYASHPSEARQSGEELEEALEHIHMCLQALIENTTDKTARDFADAALTSLEDLRSPNKSAGERMIESAKEALAIAKGEQPAASIWVNGHKYVPACGFIEDHQQLYEDWLRTELNKAHDQAKHACESSPSKNRKMFW